MIRQTVAEPILNESIHDKRVREPLHYEDLAVGDRWKSGFRVITAQDVCTFSQLTGDFDPLHDLGGSGSDLAERMGDPEVRSPFGKPVAHGILGLSILAGLGTEYPRAATLALVTIQDWQFLSPIYFGQSVCVETVLEEMSQHGRRAGRVTWLRSLIGEDGRTLQQGRFVTLVAARSAFPRKPR